ncbi:MAG: hypothetical protein WAM73_04830 [Desulfobacterales bacterium]
MFVDGSGGFDSFDFFNMFVAGSGGFDSFDFFNMFVAGSGGFDSFDFFKASKKSLSPSFSEGLFTDEAESALTGENGAVSNSIALAADKHRSRRSYFIVNHRTAVWREFVGGPWLTEKKVIKC